MSTAELTIDVARQGLVLAVVLSLPFVGVALVVGLVVSVVQAATQVQEQTLSFAPKLAAVALMLAILGPWLGAELVRYTAALLERIPQIGFH